MLKNKCVKMLAKRLFPEKGDLVESAWRPAWSASGGLHSEAIRSVLAIQTLTLEEKANLLVTSRISPLTLRYGP